MQLQLSVAERQLLADILEETRYSFMQGAEPGRKTPERESKARECEGLLTKVYENRLQFSADELDTLTAVLKDRRHLQEQGSEQEQKRQLLQSLTDKIIELCVMI